ncbi:5-hydroxyisourate hydrolase isoform X2 [Bicyclus anynana]|uniref:5-hydroxyisourate hydrolase isoform X2 n=1 Tax=Bicyclus anynana TaxID=110368 RepID=A0ABM3LSE9_BICAN|nr:5-hydroxyisourate hydrolase isoform X2 [Bicyclus anynana]
MSRPVLSTHVLDTSTGRPVAGIYVELYKKRDAFWTQWHNTMTSSDGRIQFPFLEESMGAGTYKLKFNVEDYYTRDHKETLYPFVEDHSSAQAQKHHLMGPKRPP